jgi:hypothetical protein
MVSAILTIVNHLSCSNLTEPESHHISVLPLVVGVQVINCSIKDLMFSVWSDGRCIRLSLWCLPSNCLVPKRVDIDATPNPLSHLLLPVWCSLNCTPLDAKCYGYLHLELRRIERRSFRQSTH